jgi:hypothetical protein
LQLEAAVMKNYASNKATEVELWGLHHELKTAMTELITNKNYAGAAKILRQVDRRMAGLLNAMSLVPEPPDGIAGRANGKHDANLSTE